MNTKNNKRRKESIDKIQRVFITLLQKQELHEITVAKICKEAGLNRSTFYANYIDIYDLADKMKEHLEEEVNRLFEEEVAKGFNSNDYLKLFRHIKENQLFYRTYFKLGYDNNYRIKLYDTHQAERHFDNQYIDYHIEFFKCGLNAVIKKWLAKGCLESPEEMYEIIQSEYRSRT